MCFSPDNKEILTASGDKTAKIWNAESGELVVYVFTLAAADIDIDIPATSLIHR